MKNRFSNLSLQRKIGISISFFTVLLLILRFSNNVSYPIYENVMIISVLLLMISTAILNNKILQSIQCHLFIILGLFYIHSEWKGFTGYWMFINGIILFYKYGYMNKNMVFKSILVGAVFLANLVISISLSLSSFNIIYVIAYSLFTLFSFVILYFLFEEQILKLLSENKEVNEKLLSIKSVSIVGERASSIVHSLKNNISQLNASVMCIEEGVSKDTGIKNLKNIIHEMTKRIDTIMLVSKSSYSTEETVFDAAKLLDGIMSLFLCERTFFELIKVNIDIKETYLKAVEIEFIMLIENIIKNSIEAIFEKDESGTLTVFLNNEYLEIINSGGSITQCKGCKALNDCAKECKVFNRIGNTSKKSGSGNGVSQIFKTVSKNNWTIKLTNLEYGVSYKIYFKEKT